MSGPNGEGPLPTVNVSIRFPQDELDDLDRQAEAEFRTRSQMIRVAMAEYLRIHQHSDKDTP